MSKIPIYTIYLDEMCGPSEKTVSGILDSIQTELEESAKNWALDYSPSIKQIRIKIDEMDEAEYDALPEFQGY